MAWRKEILLQRWNHLTNKYIFWGFREILFFGTDTKIGETLDKVYRVKRWLYWKIKLLFYQKTFVWFKKSRTYWLALVGFNKELKNWLRGTKRLRCKAPSCPGRYFAMSKVKCPTTIFFLCIFYISCCGRKTSFPLATD